MDFVPGILLGWARILLCCLDITGILLENGVWDNTRLYGTRLMEFMDYQRPELDLLLT
jgi:hypothetical protein